MGKKTLVKRIKDWADEVGQERAQVVLIGAKLGLSTAQKLISGKYESNPKRIAKTLESILENEKAS